MKLYCFFASILVRSGAALGASTATTWAPHLVYPQLVGKPYSGVRLTLSAAGNMPVPARESFLCFYETEFCKYPELDACAVDIPACTLTWREKGGQFLHVHVDMTLSGSDPRVSLITEDAYK